MVGRKRSYIITDKGLDILKEEYSRLMNLIEDGRLFLGGEYDEV